MNRLPEVSIVMPFRDAATTLGDSLGSIARQRFDQFELLAIDDGSTDGSPDIVSQYAERDPRVRLLRAGRPGLVAALNMGLAESRGSLIARMDADDIMHEVRIRAQRDFLQQHNGIALVASRVELIPRERIRPGYREYVRWQDRWSEPQEIEANIFVESPFVHPTVMVRRSVLEQLGGYAEGPFPEDYELWLRMARAGHKMAKLPEVLLSWRDHDQRASRLDPRYSLEAFDRLRARYLAEDPRVQGAREVVIWGAGRRTRQRARLLLDKGVRVCAWIDTNPRRVGKQIWGLPVHLPGWLDNHPRPFVLIYVRSHFARDEIVFLLLELGYACGSDFLAVG